MPPFPSFIPSLSLSVKNCVVLNSGDSIVAVHYFLPTATNSPAQQLLYTANLVQWFSSSTSSAAPSVSSSPSHILPVDVYCGDKLMADVSHEKCLGEVCIQQVSLDVELWVNGVLERELTARHITYHSLTDYDLQLAEVCAGRGCAVLILVVLLEATPP
jgi:hypothetical protein